jgi:hypothetical protein
MVRWSLLMPGSNDVGIASLVALLAEVSEAYYTEVGATPGTKLSSLTQEPPPSLGFQTA